MIRWGLLKNAFQTGADVGLAERLSTMETGKSIRSRQI